MEPAATQPPRRPGGPASDWLRSRPPPRALGTAPDDVQASLARHTNSTKVVEWIIGGFVLVCGGVGFLSDGLGSAIGGLFFGGLLALPFLSFSQRRKRAYAKNWETGRVVDGVVRSVAEGETADFTGTTIEVWDVDIEWTSTDRVLKTGRFRLPRRAERPAIDQAWPLFESGTNADDVMVLQDPMSFAVVSQVKAKG